jgi:hypothetical protein
MHVKWNSKERSRKPLVVAWEHLFLYPRETRIF